MVNQGEYERMIQEFKREQRTVGQTLKKIWGTLLAITIVIIVAVLMIFPQQFSSSETAWILPVYGGMLLVTTLIGFLVSLNYLSEKPFFTTLFPELYEKINFDEGLYLEYTPYEKVDREFVRVGGLFTRGASVKVRRHVQGTTEEQLRFDIYDCTLTTSNGKSQQVHFDGTYFILEKQLFTSLQIRSNGSPRLKGVKFERVSDIEHVRVYKEVSQTMSSIDSIVLRYVETLLPADNHKRVYCSVVDGFIHLAITYKKHPARKQKNVSLTTVNGYYDHFKEELQIAEQIAQLNNY